MAEEVLNNNRYLGYETKICASNVNVRDFPSVEGKADGKLNSGDTIVITGISSALETVAANKGYWIRIHDKGEKVYGWVFSKFVTDSALIVPSRINFEKFIPSHVEDRTQYSDKIILSVVHNGKKYLVDEYPIKYSNQDFYTFTVNSTEVYSYYFVTPGTYVYYPKNNKIMNVSIRGSGSCAYVQVTDDFKYLLQDYGSSPGIRKLEVWDLSSQRIVFAGNHYSGNTRDILVSTHEFEFVYGDSEMNTPEMVEYIAGFKKNNPSPKSKGLGVRPIVIGKFNLNNGLKTRVRCEYISTQ